MNYILAFLFLAFLVFEYLHTQQFLGNIQGLTKVISELKAFSMGKVPDENKPVVSEKIPSDPDFGLGELVKDIKQAEGEEQGF